MKMVWKVGRNHRHPRTDAPCIKLLPVGHSLGKPTYIWIHRITLAPDLYHFEGFKQLFQVSKMTLFPILLERCEHLWI